MTTSSTDCLVIGAGVAGAVYAMQAARAGLEVTLITGADELQTSNSVRAQGGIIYDEVDPALLQADIDAASAGSANPAVVAEVVRAGPRLVRELLIEELQVPFDRDPEGGLRYTREGSHSRSRVIYVKDHTGRAILGALHGRLHELVSGEGGAGGNAGGSGSGSGSGSRSRSGGRGSGGGNLTVATGCIAVDLLTLSHSSANYHDRYHPLTCIGAYVLDTASGQVRAVVARKTVLATGGLGQIFLHTTNDEGAFGHGIAMAYRVGARVIDMEYVQFHPTVFHHPGAPPFLVSEAVRGEGGVLINRAGTAFMDAYHPQGSLAPRDVIARSIHSELLKSGSPTVYIDLSRLDANYVRSRFPTIYARLLAAGVDMTRGPIPVVPAAHYACGGIHTDLAGNTNIANLSAIGETACTGLHGANRLASTSLLECVVMGVHCARQHAAELTAGSGTGAATIRWPPAVRPWQMADTEPDADLITQDLSLIRNTMWNYVGLVRTGKRLERANSLLRELRTEVDSFYADNSLTPRLLSSAQRPADRPPGDLRRTPQPAQRGQSLPRRRPRPPPQPRTVGLV